MRQAANAAAWRIGVFGGDFFLLQVDMMALVGLGRRMYNKFGKQMKGLIIMRDYSFGNFIQDLRMRRGLSQFQLGMLVGVSDKAVSKKESLINTLRINQLSITK